MTQIFFLAYIASVLTALLFLSLINVIINYSTTVNTNELFKYIFGKKVK